MVPEKFLVQTYSILQSGCYCSGAKLYCEYDITQGQTKHQHIKSTKEKVH